MKINKDFKESCDIDIPIQSAGVSSKKKCFSMMKLLEATQWGYFQTNFPAQVVFVDKVCL
jgi:hypothetical protein